MIQLHRACIAIIFSLILPGAVFSEALVVDESENFAMLDQNEAAEQQPLAREQPHLRNPSQRHASNQADRDYNDEQPIAREAHTSRPDSNQIQGLQQEIQELRGQLELQAHELSVLKEQQLSFYKDFDARLRNSAPPSLKKASLTPEAVIQAPPPATAELPLKKIIPETRPVARNNNPAEEQIRYLAAYDLIKTKRISEATLAMQSFTADYPRGGYTANAHYWLGELYLIQKDYPHAITQFETVLHEFPSSSKSAPSLLKIGYAEAYSGKKQEAIEHFKQVIKNYPDTNTAQMAKGQLKTLRR